MMKIWKHWNNALDYLVLSTGHWRIFQNLIIMNIMRKIKQFYYKCFGTTDAYNRESDCVNLYFKKQIVIFKNANVSLEDIFAQN